MHKRVEVLPISAKGLRLRVITGATVHASFDFDRDAFDALVDETSAKCEAYDQAAIDAKAKDEADARAAADADRDIETSMMRGPNIANPNPSTPGITTSGTSATEVVKAPAPAPARAGARTVKGAKPAVKGHKAKGARK